jgi:hypothetical protein
MSFSTDKKITSGLTTAFEELENDEYYNFGEKMGATLAGAASKKVESLLF